MFFHEAGIESISTHYFATPSQLARKLHFYPTGLGNFYVRPPYRVCRLNYDSYLLLLVRSGTLLVDRPNGAAHVEAGYIALIDCHQSHQYYAAGDCNFSFLHFDGAASDQFYQEITSRYGCVFILPEPEWLAGRLQELLDLFFENSHPNEADISVKIHAILCFLLKSGTAFIRPQSDGTPIEQAAAYIHSHLACPLTVDRLAKVAGFSGCYFSRVFRQKTGLTPYHYILTARLDKAKQLLNTTDLNIKQIALEVGFPSVPNFINTFKKQTGFSPACFRKMPL